MALGRLLTTVKSSALGYRFLNRRVTTMRFGIARGLKRRGGLGVLGLFREESEETRFVRSLELNGRIAFDLGANFGAFTLYFCKAVGPSGYVYAFDPIPANCQAVMENLSLNHLTNATVIQKAVGDRSSEITFTLDPKNTTTASGNPLVSEAIRRRAETETLTVAQVALDDMVRDGELTVPDLVKIDVEGMEAKVLEGMQNLLEQRAPDLYIEMHGANREEKLANGRQVCALLWQADYEIHHVEHNVRVTSESADRAASGHLYCTPAAKNNGLWKR